MENVMDFLDSHKTKGKTAIACIGMMTSMTDFSSLCIIWTWSSPQSAKVTRLNWFYTKSYSTLLPLAITLIGYAGMRVLVGCLCFIGVPTVSLSKFSIALLILLWILGMGMTCQRIVRLPSSISKHWFVHWQSWRHFVTRSTCIKPQWLPFWWCWGMLQLTWYLHGIVPRLVNSRRTTSALHLQMEFFDPTQMLPPIPNSITETNANQLPLMGMMKTSFLVKSRRNLVVQ